MDQHNLLDEIVSENFPKTRRRKLLPWWIKVFIWIFIVSGIMTIPVFLMGLFGYNFEIAMYGLETRDPRSIIGVVLGFVFLIKGITAYGLWTEKDWGIKLGMIDASGGIIICMLVMLIPYLIPDLGLPHSFRLELVILVPYFIRLKRISQQWEISQIN